jgi:hypothetical protein
MFIEIFAMVKISITILCPCCSVDLSINIDWPTWLGHRNDPVLLHCWRGDVWTSEALRLRCSISMICIHCTSTVSTVRLIVFLLSISAGDLVSTVQAAAQSAADQNIIAPAIAVEVKVQIDKPSGQVGCHMLCICFVCACL